MAFSLFKSKTKPSSSTPTFSKEIEHDAFFTKLIAKEYSRLLEANHCYLDYTGGNLYAASQIDTHFKQLKENVLGNPHSTNPTSILATKLVADARQKVLDYFNAEDYYCIFTPNATGALKIVGECYPFDEKSNFLLLSDNHNSVNGIREYCLGKKGSFEYSPIRVEDLLIDEEILTEQLNSKPESTNKLFAFPAQSNVSGVKHDLEWINKAQEKGWDVLLDAAAYVPSSKLDLKKFQPDFVSVSFYKIFGYPTGLGCLLVKKTSFDKLIKPWFAGGTIKVVSVGSTSHYLMNDHERFENGTINYLDIPALKIGLDYIETIGIDRIQERVSSLINYLYKGIKDLKHSNGNNILRIFGPNDRANHGGTVIMSFTDKNGVVYPFQTVEERANKKMISIRSGCFCNPGIDEVKSCITTEELAGYFTGRKDGDYFELMEVLNVMRGSTRASVGIATTKKDIDTFIQFVASFKDLTL